MNKGGVGVGSASVVLVFAVLCLTVFSLITYVVAGNDKALVDAEASLVIGYYEADALAEHILAEILISDPIPEAVRGIDIDIDQHEFQGAKSVRFLCPISDNKELYVHVVIREGFYDILTWRMRDTDDWEFDDTINVWGGFDD